MFYAVEDTTAKKRADCILQSDERTEQRLVQLGGRIEKAITSNEPGVINATLKGILDISISFSQNNSQFYHNKNIKNEIFNALNTLEKVYNDTTVPKGNWWYWEIGIPLSINSIFTLMYDYTDKSQLKRYMAAEKHFNDRIKLTGANRLWESDYFCRSRNITFRQRQYKVRHIWHTGRSGYNRQR